MAYITLHSVKAEMHYHNRVLFRWDLFIILRWYLELNRSFCFAGNFIAKMMAYVRPFFIQGHFRNHYRVNTQAHALIHTRSWWEGRYCTCFIAGCFSLLFDLSPRVLVSWAWRLAWARKHQVRRVLLRRYFRLGVCSEYLTNEKMECRLGKLCEDRWRRWWYQRDVMEEIKDAAVVAERCSKVVGGSSGVCVCDVVSPVY